MRSRHQFLLCPCCALIVLGLALAAAQPASKTYKGLELTVTGVTRATNVGLSDCPPGANTQRGVIKPGDTTEFASVTVDFKVTPAFKPGMLPKPTLTDDTGKTYNTAQSFAEIGSSPSFSCTFSFRIPKGGKVAKFTLDTVSFDVSAMP
jgi:hypothetical protein